MLLCGCDKGARQTETGSTAWLHGHGIHCSPQSFVTDSINSKAQSQQWQWQLPLPVEAQDRAGRMRWRHNLSLMPLSILGHSEAWSSHRFCTTK